MSDVTDLFPEGTFTEDPPDEGEEATNEVADEPEESGADTEEADAEEPTEAPLIFGKYKTLEDAEKGHKELERQFHERQQQPAEEVEEDEDEDPFGLWGTALGNDEANQLAQQMIERPHQAAEIVAYVDANQHLFGQNGAEIADQMFALWHAQNPRAALKWHNEQERAEHDARIAERTAPLEESHRNQVAGFTVARAKAEIPRYTEFESQVYAEIAGPKMQQFLADNPSYKTDPEKQFAMLDALVAKHAWIEFKQNQQLANAANGGPAPEIPAKAKPRTQQRSSVAPPASDDVDDLFPAGTFRKG